MSGPVILVTQDSDGTNIGMAFAEEERDFYANGPAVVLTFDAEHNLWWGTTLRMHSPEVRFEVDVAMWRLTRNPWTDVSDMATHWIPELGAPLEPIQRSTAA